MPASIHVIFRPDRPLRGPLPSSMLRGIAASLFEDEGPEAHRNNTKYYSVTPIWLPEGAVFPADVFGLTFTEHIDDAAVIERMMARLHRGVRIGRHGSADVVSVAVDEHSWVDFTSPVAGTDTLVELVSPTCFSRDGSPYLLPDPHVVVASLTMRWNQCAGASGQSVVEPEVVDDLRRSVSVVGFDCAGSRHSVGGGRGVTGWVRFAVEARPSDPIAVWWSAMWRLAEITGLGAGTTSGQGRVLVDFRRPERRRE